MSPLKIDPYIVDTLMADLVGHDRHPSAFLVYLYLSRQAALERGAVVRSLNDVAKGTGLSKRTVQTGIKRLVSRGLLKSTRPTDTAVPSYEVCTPWKR